MFISVNTAELTLNKNNTIQSLTIQIQIENPLEFSINVLKKCGIMDKHFKDFIYRFDKPLSGGRESWWCPRKACKGRLRITADGQMIEQQGHDHAKIAVTEIRRRGANSRDTPRVVDTAI